MALVIEKDIRRGLRTLSLSIESQPRFSGLARQVIAEGDLDGWFLNDLVARANDLFGHIMDVDAAVQEGILMAEAPDMTPFVRYVSGEIRQLLVNWLESYDASIGAARLEALPGGPELLANVAEARAMLNPNMSVGGKIAVLRDEAIAEHRADKTVDLLEGLTP